MFIFSHEDLISRGGHYYDMWQQQLTKLEETDTANGNNGSGSDGNGGVNGNGANIVVTAEMNGIARIA